MGHDERRAASYVAGTLTAAQVESFEAHLVECDRCWAAVAEDHRGRAMGESLRELAPPDLRDRVRMQVESLPSARRLPARHRRRGRAAFLVLVAIIGGGVLVVPRGPGADRDPEAVAAVMRAADGRLPPGSVVAGGQRVALWHDMVDGRPVTVGRSDEPLPMPAESHAMGDEPGSPWVAERGSVKIVCLSRPYHLIVVGTLPAERLVRWAAGLDLGPMVSR